MAHHGELDAAFQIDSCARRSVGPCDLVDCSVNDGGMSMPATAGTVSVSGLAGLTASVTPGADGTYAPSQLSGRLWTNATALSVFSGGGVVPKFTESLKTPVKDLVLLSPFGSAISIDSQQDYNVSWGTPIDDDQVQMVIEMDAGATLTCAWSGNELMVAIPTLALGLVPRGTGQWRIETVQRKQAIDADWVLSLAATQIGHDTNGTPTSGTLVLQ